MLDRHDNEAWALHMANAITMREGLKLAEAAQWLDKKRTRESVFELRTAIAACLLEATRIQVVGQ